MNITKDVVSDLFPLYTANECSADTRVLVEEYLRHHPQDAAELRQILSTPLPGPVPFSKNLDEMKALQKARRLVRRRSWLLAFAIFFSLSPFSFLHVAGRTYWLFIESPKSALIYGTIGAVLWIVYAVVGNRSKNL